MALVNPSNLYTGGVVSLNPNQYVNLALRARAQRQAKDEAIDNYYKKLPDTLNDKGIRDQEIPVINEYKNKIFEYGLQNKEALRNPKIDNGAAQLGLQKMFREAQGIARSSQNAAKTQLELGKLRFNKEAQHVFDDPTFLELQHANNLPVNDPNYKDIDLANLVVPPKPFDQKEYVKRFSDIKMSDGTPTISEHPTDKNFKVITTNPLLDEGGKKALYARAAEDLHNDRSFAKKIKEGLDGGQLENLRKISKEVFGHDIENDEDIAAAFAYSLIPPKVSTQKVVNNKEAETVARNKEWDRRKTRSFNDSMALIAANKKGGVPNYDELGYLSDAVADEVGVNQTVELGGKQKEVRVIYTDMVDPKRLAIINANNAVKPIPIKQPDGKVRMGYYQDRTTGDWDGLDNKGQPMTISRERVKDDYVNKQTPTKFKLQQGTKASENTKQSIKGW